MSQLQDNRIALAITAYFVSATASLAWIIHRATPASSTWKELLINANALLESVLPSELAVFVLLNFFVSALAMVAVITSALFLGRLSVNESRRLSHRLVKYAVLKMVFVGSVITPDPRDIAVWLAWFAVVGYLRVFLGAAKDRLESLLIAPGAQLGRHARGVCLLLMVLVHNLASFFTVLRLLPRYSLTRTLLCAFDSAIIAIEGTKTLIRYVVHMSDRYMCFRAMGPPLAAEGDDPLLATAATAATAEPGTGGVAAAAGGGGGWDFSAGSWAGKGSFLYHVELVADLLVHAVTLAHYMHVWVLHGLSFHLIDAVLFMDMRAVLLSLLRRLRNHLTYRAATHRINNTFPDVHPAAVAATGGGGSADCTICMDEIVHVAKQLPCGHIFHLSCLRAWLQQSGNETFTCPNCRQPILIAGGGRGLEDGGEAGARGWGDSNWRLIAALDRAYVRLVVAVEPFLLTMLLRLTLWLGGRAQTRRRSVRVHAAQPREGFGESPGPPVVPRAAVASADSYHSDAYDQTGADDDEDVNLYGSGDSRGHHLRDEQRSGGDFNDDDGIGGAHADSDVELDGVPELLDPYGNRRGARQRRAGTRHGAHKEDGAGEEREAGPRTAERRSGRGNKEAEGGWCLARHQRSGAGGRRTGAELPPEQPQQLRAPSSRQALKEGPGLAGPEADNCCWHHGSGRPARRTAPSRGLAVLEEQEERDGGGAGPSRGTGPAARHRSRGLLPPPSAEVPTYSGDVLAQHAAAAARQLGRTVSESLRSSWGVGGVCAGAVAGASRDDDDSDQEVCSRRRRTRPRQPAAPREAAGMAGGSRRGPLTSTS